MSQERYSHPASGDDDPILLTNHLRDVARRAESIVPSTTTHDGYDLSELAYRIGFVHDFGKLTTWFQQHIRDGDPDGPTDHSPLGAFVADYVAARTGGSDEDALTAFVAVARHHGALPNVGEYVYERTIEEHYRSSRKDIVQQVEDIDEHVPELADEILDEATDGNGSWDDFAGSIRSEEAFEAVGSRLNGMPLAGLYDPPSEEFYATVLQAWSALVLADKTSASRTPEEQLDHRIPETDHIREHIASLPKDHVGTHSDREQQLNKLRADAREAVLDGVESLIRVGDQVATLTLPTGLGKTLTGLDAAFTLRDETDRRRVVYALPFTSIVDQVADVVGDVFDTDGTSDLLTVHHHLAETVTVPGDANEGTDELAHVAELLGESWRSGITVTTFVQLFESLAGPTNAQSLKLPALYDSVVILDEPQSLPHDWWPLVRRLVEILVEEYDAAVIAMTATQPSLFEDIGEELVNEPKQYYEDIDRVAFAFHESVDGFDDTDSTIGYEDAAVELLDATTQGSVLAVCNTIDSARELTEAATAEGDLVNVADTYRNVLRREGGADDIDPSTVAGLVEDAVSDDGAAFLHLTTRVRPCDRLVLLDVAKELTNRDVPLLSITTQLVEAGVDISFDEVYRDLAPMDSIVQAAGRCNRSFEREQGSVTVWWLDAPANTSLTPGEAVYNRWGNSLLSHTILALDTIRDGDHRLDEPAVAWNAVREYYRRLVDLDPGDNELVTWVNDAEAEQLSSESLIDQRLAVDVVVVRTSEEQALVDKIDAAWETADFAKLDELVDETRRLQVSIPVYRSDSTEADKLADLRRLHADSELRVLDAGSDRYANYFDATTGLVVPDSTVEARFL